MSFITHILIHYGGYRLLEDVLANINRVAVQKFGAEYSETRAQKLFKTMLTLKEGRVEAAKQGIENGVALRVLVNGAWGFASVGSLDAEVLMNTVSDACRMAKNASLRLKTPVKLAEAKTVEDRVQIKPKKTPSSILMEDKISTALEINKAVLGYDKRVKGCSIDYLDLTGTSHFMNSEGTRIEQDKLYVWSRITATAVSKGVFTFSREEIGSTSGYEVFESAPEAIGEKVAKRSIQQLGAKMPKGGKSHLAEADLALAGGVLQNNLGKKIGSDLVTFYDDGTIDGAFGSFKYDDEGVPAQKTLLIKDGVVTGLMHSRETAQKLKAEPTGNVRAENFRVEPIIRMRNTFMSPRDHSFEELVEGVSSGYYFKSFRGGQANLDGTFQVGTEEAFEIVKGEIGDPVRGASISGNTLETLSKVDAVGKDFELWPGRCGKGQTAFICDGGPHIRVKVVIVGGSA
jgi:TldD protein